MQVRALITRPATGQELACGSMIVRGVAWSGAAPIALVEVSVADGPWQKARLVGHAGVARMAAVGIPGQRLAAGGDAASAPGRRTWPAGASPEQPEWNGLGYGANFIHEIRVRLH